MHFTIPGELTDLNAYIKALNSCRWSGNSIKHSETDRVAFAAKVARIGKVEKYPVRIIYCWYCKDNRKDTDNVAFAKKFINDGLVTAGVLQNDSRKFVAGFVDQFYIDKSNPRVEVYIEQLPE
ncbi:TPA: hypothetical protein DEB29_03585 [Candidatus Wolfebacteria bacterium]|nr:hypothetical protein [Candidatus Wolfebacteria bacterium]